MHRPIPNGHRPGYHPRNTGKPLMNTIRRKYRVLGRTSSPCGQTTITIRCPWCDSSFTAYVWSLAGSGKRCPSCGSLHTSTNAYAPPERTISERVKDGNA